MAFLCAECGCNCVRGHVLDKCANPDCCCAAMPLRDVNTLADEVRHAMETLDLAAMAALLAPDARWGAPEQDVPTCRNASQIISWYQMARENGISADVTRVEVIDDNVVVGLMVRSTADGEKAEHSSPQERWQVLSIEGGLVGEIRGYESRDEATDFATTGTSNWKT